MENQVQDQTTVERTETQPSQSKGGDSSRSKTAILLIAILLPATILASLAWDSNINGALDILVTVYKIVFQVGIGVLLFMGLNEAANFIFPVEVPRRGASTAYWMLILLGMGTFISMSLNLFNIGYFNNWRIWLFIFTMAYLIVTSTSSVDFKDIATALFMVIIYTLYIISLTWTITSGGWQVFVLAVGIAIMADTFAYYGGKKYGKKKAFPEVSPNKTVEGLILGFFAAVMFGWIFWLVAFKFTTAALIYSSAMNTKMVLFILVAALISPFGDLTFSKIKRSYDKKDYSDLLPGHGGIFDRLDSHIFVTTALVFMMTM